MTLYQELKQTGIEIVVHESDIQFPVTIQTTEILKKHPDAGPCISTFHDTITGKLWYDVAFAYDVFWEG